MYEISIVTSSILIALALIVIAIWYSPLALDHLAALLDSRACALRQYKETFRSEQSRQKISRGIEYPTPEDELIVGMKGIK